jgi:hypothetical protein
MARYVRDVSVQDVECDEIWSFIGKKESAFARKTIRILAMRTRS